APTEAAPPPPPPPTNSPPSGETYNLSIGTTLVVNDNDGTVEITVTRVRTVNEGCRSFAPEPRKGRYLIADVTATVTKGTASINPIYFEWVAADGTTVNGLAGILAGCGETIGSGNNLPAGTKRVGTVVFDVADTNGVVEYKPLFRSAGSWRP
ncbi:DUF4352 domain-containing protein, partial [Verrucosispora sp. SN26_14.1]